MTALRKSEIPEDADYGFASDIPELQDWGRWIRNQPATGPGKMLSPEAIELDGHPIKAPSMWALLGNNRDEDDEEKETVNSPDTCERVNQIVFKWSTGDDRHSRYQARLLAAYYLQYPDSIRRCALNFPVNEGKEARRRASAQLRKRGSRYNRFSEKEFSDLLRFAEGAFVNEFKRGR